MNIGDNSQTVGGTIHLKQIVAAFAAISAGPSTGGVQIAVDRSNEVAHHSGVGRRQTCQRRPSLASVALPTEMCWKIPVMESELHRSSDGGRGTARRRRAAATGWEPVTVDAS